MAQWVYFNKFRKIKKALPLNFSMVVASKKGKEVNLMYQMALLLYHTS